MGSIDTKSSSRVIPTVDISAWLSPDSSAAAKRQVVNDMSDACSTYGFFYLVGHGISPEIQAKALEVDRLFFSLPKEKRMEVWIGKSLGKSFRGYEPAGMQTHHEGLLPDTKEVSGLPCETFPSLPIIKTAPQIDFHGWQRSV